MELDQETYRIIHETAANVRFLRENREEDRKDVEDHETRLRKLERDRLMADGENRGTARIAAIVGGIVALVIAGLQALGTILRWW